jgi:KaiC/GvpD/RAD55 family RecA-like ATPase
MDTKLIARFSADAASATTASDIIELAKGTFGDLEDYADYIIAFAKEKGIDVTDELQELKEKTTQAKEGRKRQKLFDDTQENTKQQADIVEQYQKNLLEGHSPDEPKMMQAMSDLRKLTTSLTVPQDQSCFATFEEYERERFNYDPAKEFAPTLFGGIPFPEGTVSYIGARMSRGKTAAMINLTREALTHKTNQRKVIFVTLEMAANELITRLIHSVNYATHQDKTGPENALWRIGEHKDKELLSKLYDHAFRGTESKEELFHPFAEYTHTAIDEVKNFMNKKLITFYDTTKHEFDTIIENIERYTNVGDLVLLDYIQRMPSTNKARDGYARVKYISEGICRLAKSTGSIIIAGAQFSRDAVADAKEKSRVEKKADVFGENSYRESGDIEQDAHNAIGIGWTSKNGDRFYEVLKSRSSGYVGEAFYFDWNGAYCYMAGTKEKYIAGAKRGDSPVNNNHGAGSKPTPQAKLPDLLDLNN